MRPIYERIFASFVRPEEQSFRWLTQSEVTARGIAAKEARLAAAGILKDPFGSGRLYRKVPSKVARVVVDPFRVGRTVERSEAAFEDDEDVLIPWAMSDRLLYFASLGRHETAGASADDPFRVGLRPTPTQNDMGLGPFHVTTRP